MCVWEPLTQNKSQYPGSGQATIYTVPISHHIHTQHTMTSSEFLAFNTIKTNKLLFNSYVSKAPVCIINEMRRRDLLDYSDAVRLKTSCRFDGDVGVRLIDIVVGKGDATCEKFIKYLCQVEITNDPALTELHQLGTHDVPADADFQNAVLRHERDLAPIISLQAADFIEALAQHKVLSGYHKKAPSLPCCNVKACDVQTPDFVRRKMSDSRFHKL